MWMTVNPLNTKPLWNLSILEYKAFVEFIYGKLVGDKGYIGRNLFERLFVDGIQLITKLKSNMKGALMSLPDKLLLRQLAIIETVNDELKNIAQVGHYFTSLREQ